MMWHTLVSALLGVTSVHALVARQNIAPLSTSQIDAFTPYSYYAAAAYCRPAKSIHWDCGVNCDANPGFKPLAAGGDGDSVPYWYVGYDVNLKTVIVAHEGSDPVGLLAYATDANFTLSPLDPTYFPGLPSNIQVHSGFASQQAVTASNILMAVKTIMSNYSTTHVTVVGHSLGGAIALLDSVYLPLHLPNGTLLETVIYGLPRVGNKAFADYIDAKLPLAHITNKKDFIPIIPSLSAGYVHPSGEIHIDESGAWELCPGQDNPSVLCAVGDVPSVLEGNALDSLGPYNGVFMGIC